MTNEQLKELAAKNPPPQEWFEDGEEECPFVPLVPVASVRVHYEYVGELKPMPYDWDD